MKKQKKFRSWWLFATLVCALTIAFMAGSLNGEFLNWDDDRIIVNNPRVHSFSVANIAYAFGGLAFESYQPLHLVSYMIDGHLWPGNALGYRAHNLALYLGAVLLLFWLFKRIGLGPISATIGCLFFALAPYRVESVAWITGRKDVLMLLLALGSWHLYLSSFEEGRFLRSKRLCSLFLFVAALLSKSSALVLPAMMLIVDVAFFKRPLKRSLIAASPFAVIALAFAAALPMIWSRAEMVRQPISPGFTGRIALVGWTVSHYMTTLLWPFGTSPMYAEPTADELIRGMIVGYGTIFLFVLAFYFARKKSLHIGKSVGAIVLFFVALIPFLNFVPLYFLAADRYLLLPTIGVSLGVGLICEAAQRSQDIRRTGNRRGLSRATPVLLSALIPLYAVATVTEARAWTNSEKLWRHAVSRQPKSFYAWIKLGETLRKSGRPSESAEAYRAAQRIRPLSPIALGGVFWAELLVDADNHPSVSHELAEKLTYRFLAIANNAHELIDFARYLRKQQLTNASEVVLERLTAYVKPVNSAPISERKPLRWRRPAP
ncbi:MAG: hypothetical protein JXA30_07695 [Deltaproteobacteria bacterium]|nr:hypothetical protein [Deltaproteobacteria bacterium]